MKNTYRRLHVHTLMVWVGFLAVLCGLATTLYRALSPVSRASRSLSSGSPSQRGMALWALAGALPPWEHEEAYKILAGALGDPEPNVRLAAAESLRSYPEHSSEFVPLIVPLVKSNEPHVRERALFILETIVKPGTPEAATVIPLMVAALAASKPNVRLETSRALLVVGQGKLAIPALVRLMHEERGTRRLGALGFLLRMNQLPEDIEPDLKEMLQSDSLTDRMWASTALVRMGKAAPATPVLSDLLKSSNVDARLHTAENLISLGELEAALPVVREAENNQDQRIRLWAATILNWTRQLPSQGEAR